MKEQLIVKFKLPMLENLPTISAIVNIGYEKTGNKFSVAFNGSKGYLSNIEISCEGVQPERNNVIWVENLRNQKGGFIVKMVLIYHSPKTGVRIELADS